VVEKGVPQMLAGEWIRNLQEQLPTRLELACPTPLACQVSHGSAHFTRIADEFSSALHSADRALYRSKSARLPLD
jgi:PleD family two-component response regulator